MAQRITRKMLDARVATINELLGAPMEPYTENKELGRYVANPGNYHIGSAYGGVCLHRMSNESGGVSNVFNTGFIPARQLYDQICAFINGIQTSRGE